MRGGAEGGGGSSRDLSGAKEESCIGTCPYLFDSEERKEREHQKSPKTGGVGDSSPFSKRNASEKNWSFS